MAFDTLNPLQGTINRLLESPRISIEPSSREILEHAREAALRVANFFDYEGRDAGSGVMKVWEEGSGVMKVLEEEMREAANGLEDALDSHVSDQLSQTESIHPLLIPVDLEGVRQHIDGFTQHMKYLKNLFIPLDKKDEDEDEDKDEDEDEDEDEKIMTMLSPDQSPENRTWIINWFASKAASMFLGMKADYIQQLDSLLPKKEEEEEEDEEDDDEDDDEDYDDDGDEEDDEEEDDDDDNFDYSGLIRSWWVKEAASVFMMGKEYNPSPDEIEGDDDGDDYAVSPTMVGLTDQFCEIRDSLLKDPDKSPYTVLWGMAGLGKTALAMKILQDPLISTTFQSRIFLRIGPKYDVRNVVKDILAQLQPHNDTIHMEEDEECLRGYLWDILKVRKILIVFDDVWDPFFWYHIRGEIPYYKNDSRCRFLVTSRLNDVSEDENIPDYSTPYLVRFLNNIESWDLLQEKVFAGEACPRKLEKAGKQIAENCEGLPLLIITVADSLSKAEKTKEYWSKIASSKSYYK